MEIPLFIKTSAIHLDVENLADQFKDLLLSLSESTDEKTQTLLTELRHYLKQIGDRLVVEAQTHSNPDIWKVEFLGWYNTGTQKVIHISDPGDVGLLKELFYNLLQSIRPDHQLRPEQVVAIGSQFGSPGYEQIRVYLRNSADMWRNPVAIAKLVRGPDRHEGSFFEYIRHALSRVKPESEKEVFHTTATRLLVATYKACARMAEKDDYQALYQLGKVFLQLSEAFYPNAWEVDPKTQTEEFEIYHQNRLPPEKKASIKTASSEVATLIEEIQLLANTLTGESRQRFNAWGLLVAGEAADLARYTGIEDLWLVTDYRALQEWRHDYSKTDTDPRENPIPVRIPYLAEVGYADTRDEADVLKALYESGLVKDTSGYEARLDRDDFDNTPMWSVFGPNDDPDYAIGPLVYLLKRPNTWKGNSLVRHNEENALVHAISQTQNLFKTIKPVYEQAPQVVQQIVDFLTAAVRNKRYRDLQHFSVALRRLVDQKPYQAPGEEMGTLEPYTNFRDQIAQERQKEEEDWRADEEALKKGSSVPLVVKTASFQMPQIPNDWLKGPFDDRDELIWVNSLGTLPSNEHVYGKRFSDLKQAIRFIEHQADGYHQFELNWNRGFQDHIPEIRNPRIDEVLFNRLDAIERAHGQAVSFQPVEYGRTIEADWRTDELGEWVYPNINLIKYFVEGGVDEDNQVWSHARHTRTPIPLFSKSAAQTPLFVKQAVHPAVENIIDQIQMVLDKVASDPKAAKQLPLFKQLLQETGSKVIGNMADFLSGRAGQSLLARNWWGNLVSHLQYLGIDFHRIAKHLAEEEPNQELLYLAFEIEEQAMQIFRASDYRAGWDLAHALRDLKIAPNRAQDTWFAQWEEKQNKKAAEVPMLLKKAEGEPFYELLRRTHYPDGMMESLNVGGFQVSFRADRGAYCKPRLSGLQPQAYSEFEIKLLVPPTALLPFLPDHIKQYIEPSEGESKPRDYTVLGFVPAAEAQEFLDILQKHGPTIKENMELEKQLPPLNKQAATHDPQSLVDQIQMILDQIESPDAKVEFGRWLSAVAYRFDSAAKTLHNQGDFLRIDWTPEVGGGTDFLPVNPNEPSLWNLIQQGDYSANQAFSTRILRAFPKVHDPILSIISSTESGRDDLAPFILRTPGSSSEAVLRVSDWQAIESDQYNSHYLKVADLHFIKRDYENFNEWFTNFKEWVGYMEVRIAKQNDNHQKLGQQIDDLGALLIDYAKAWLSENHTDQMHQAANQIADLISTYPSSYHGNPKRPDVSTKEDFESNRILQNWKQKKSSHLPALTKTATHPVVSNIMDQIEMVTTEVAQNPKGYAQVNLFRQLLQDVGLRISKLFVYNAYPEELLRHFRWSLEKTLPNDFYEQVIIKLNQKENPLLWKLIKTIYNQAQELYRSEDFRAIYDLAHAFLSLGVASKTHNEEGFFEDWWSKQNPIKSTASVDLLENLNLAFDAIKYDQSIKQKAKNHLIGRAKQVIQALGKNIAIMAHSLDLPNDVWVAYTHGKIAVLVKIPSTDNTSKTPIYQQVPPAVITAALNKAGINFRDAGPLAVSYHHVGLLNNVSAIEVMNSSFGTIWPAKGIVLKQAEEVLDNEIKLLSPQTPPILKQAITDITAAALQAAHQKDYLRLSSLAALFKNYPDSTDPHLHQSSFEDYNKLRFKEESFVPLTIKTAEEEGDPIPEDDPEIVKLIDEKLLGLGLSIKSNYPHPLRLEHQNQYWVSLWFQATNTDFLSFKKEATDLNLELKPYFIEKLLEAFLDLNISLRPDQPGPIPEFALVGEAPSGEKIQVQGRFGNDQFWFVVRILLGSKSPPLNAKAALETPPVVDQITQIVTNLGWKKGNTDREDYPNYGTKGDLIELSFRQDSTREGQEKLPNNLFRLKALQEDLYLELTKAGFKLQTPEAEDVNILDADSTTEAIAPSGESIDIWMKAFGGVEHPYPPSALMRIRIWLGTKDTHFLNEAALDKTATKKLYAYHYPINKDALTAIKTEGLLAPSALATTPFNFHLISVWGLATWVKFSKGIVR